jgi:hypothetical protein
MMINRTRYAAIGIFALAVTGAAQAQSTTRPVGLDPKKATELTDELVVEAMRRGAEYLLKQRKGDNFETKLVNPTDSWLNGKDTRHWGGETSLVTYALLHTGQSMEDLVLRPKLSHNSAELAPVIQWLSNLDVDASYTAGLHASALALVPRKPNIEASLQRNRTWLLDAMGPYGGYTYNNPTPGTALSKYGAGAVTVDLTALFKKLQADLTEGKKAFETAGKAANNDPQKIKAAVEGYLGILQRSAAQLRTLATVAADANEPNQVLQLKPDHDNIISEHRRILESLYRDARDARLGKKLKEETPEEKVWKKRLEELKKDADRFGQRTEKKKEAKGIGDLSNGQYGTLGAWALTDANVEIPLKYWAISDAFWRDAQNPDGSWQYSPNKSEHILSMTMAGLASVFITSEFMDMELRMQPREDKTIDAGIKWVDEHYSGKNASDAYYLYGLERVGLASGYKFFGGKNWYKDSGLHLIRAQRADGSWEGGFIKAEPTIATSYSLLFLARGRNAVVFNKLIYDGPWNARPRDNANVTAWMSKQYEKPINWQVVNLQVDYTEWLDAPVLLITGSRDPKFKPEDLAKIKQFVHAGGIVFSTADGGSSQFTEAMRKYAMKISDDTYEMGMLPKDAELFKVEKDIKNPPTMLAMGNSVRYWWIHSTADLGASWQMKKYATGSHFEVPTNLYYYATGKQSPRNKLQDLTVKEDPKAKSVRTIPLTRVEFSGNWNPEPGAWPRLAKLLKNQAQTTLTLGSSPLNKLDAKTMPLAHVTATSALALRDEDKTALQTYLKDGGILLADAAGGNPEFAVSVIQGLSKLFPEAKWDGINNDHALITGSMADGKKIEEQSYRKYGMLKLGEKPSTPRLRLLTQGEKLLAIVSEDDLSSGLLGTNTWGIVGYASDTAIPLVRNMVLYAWEASRKQNPSAAGAPAK